MSRRDRSAVALRYEGSSGAPVVVASGMGYLAEKIVEVASESGVPIYEDNSLATMLSQLALGQEIPDSLYRAIVEIYVYFLNFDPSDPDKARRQRQDLRHLLLVDEGGGEAVAGHHPRVGDPPAQKRGQAEHPVVRRVKRSRHGTFTASPG